MNQCGLSLACATHRTGNRRVFALSLLLVLALSGCAIRAATEESKPPAGAWPIYYTTDGDNPGGPAVACEYRVPPTDTEVPAGLVGLLLAGPESDDLTNPFPQQTSLRTWTLTEGQLHLDLSEQYGGLSGIQLTLANYCLALTLCQSEEVDSVYITVDGAEIPFLSIKQLRAEDVILSGAEEETVSITAALWFPRAVGSGLGVEDRPVLKTEDETLAGAMLSALLAGPQYEGNRTLIPEGTKLRSVAVNDGVCAVNLSSEFLAGMPQDPAEAKLLLYSLVNTMGGLEKVHSVQILVEGGVVESFGIIPTVSPIEPDPTLGNH